MALMEGIQCLNELVTPLRLMSQWAHITLYNRIHKPELWRQFRPAARIILSSAYCPIHVLNYFRDVERLWLFIQLCIRRVFIVAFESRGNIRSCHLNLLTLNG